METVQHKTVNRAATTQPAAAVRLVHRRVNKTVSPPVVQAAMKVSKPHDMEEKEAENTSKKIMRMSIPESRIAYVGNDSGGVFRQMDQTKDEKKEEDRPSKEKKVQPKEEEKKEDPPQKGQKLQARFHSPYIGRFASAIAITEAGAIIQRRKLEGQPDVSSNVMADINNSLSGGSPLPLSVRRFMEPRFNADFSRVRIHQGEKSTKLNRNLSAQAFTVGNHIFFGKDRYQPDSEEGRELLAHELTHTIQQGGAVQRREDVTVRSHTTPQVQRSIIGDALDYIADRINNIPGFRMFTIVLGVNPITMSRVDRSAANIMRAVVEFMPGGALITQALDNHGIFDRIANWVSQQIRTLGLVGSSIRDAVMRFLRSLGLRDAFRLGEVWNRAKRIFTDPINRIKSFVRGLVSRIIEFIKDAILRPLAVMASRTRGWNLLCAVLGRNPITGDPVPRTADTLIGGFMTLIGQQEVWNNIKRARAVPRAWGWFQGALAGLMGFVRSIPTLFMNVFRSLGIRDLLNIPGAFARVARVFAGFAGRFFSWAGAQVMNLLQIIFEVVAPGVMPFIRRAVGAFRSIIRNPVGFLRNLVRAGKLGLRSFLTNFLTHLRTSLINWLTGTLAGTGVYIPQAFTLRELIKFVLSVLGLTWQNIRQKLVRVVGERVVAAMEAGFELIRTLVVEGPAAAWQKISEGLTNLREMVIEQVMNFVRSRIVQASITRLVSLLSPAGAFIQAILGIYNTIMFFVERLRTIAQVAMSFVNSIAAIAAGRLRAAAARVERTMAGALTLVISFLARIVGLGRVATVVTNLINRVRAPIDRALDRVVAWIVAQARRLGRFVMQAGVPQDPRERLRLAARAAVSAARRLAGRITRPLLTSAMAVIKSRYGLREIAPYERNGSWWVKISINPEVDEDLGVASGGAASAGPAGETATARVVQGSWIKNLQANSFERVSNPSTVVRRSAGGETQVVRFGTVKPDGGSSSFAYAREGADWERSNFTHVSSYVMPQGGASAKFVLKPQYRNSSYIRPNFYRDSDASRRAIVSSKLPGLIHPTIPARFLSEAPASQEAARGYTQTFNGRAMVPINVASPDHDPPIADHWTNRQGNSTTQSSRESWNSRLSTYKLMSRSLNLSLGSRGENYTEEVGLGFRGPGE